MAGVSTPYIRRPPRQSARPSNRRPTSAQGAQAQPLDVAHAIGLALAAGPRTVDRDGGRLSDHRRRECIGGIGRERRRFGKPTPASHAPPVEAIGAKLVGLTLTPLPTRP